MDVKRRQHDRETWEAIPSAFATHPHAWKEPDQLHG